jgi:hypothetical protein
VQTIFSRSIVTSVLGCGQRWEFSCVFCRGNMKKTRTTAAEKLVILRNIIVQGKCAWNLKELERDGSKAGIVTQAIKDVLQSLCDDNLVDQDKIGSGSFFWSFSSKQQVRLEGKIKALDTEKEDLLAKQAELQARAKEASATRNGEVRSANCIVCLLVTWRVCAKIGHVVECRGYAQE